MFVAADLLVVALRALSFVAIFQAAGAAIFVALFGPRLDAAASERLLSLTRIAAVAALVLTVLTYVFTPARMAGSFGGTFDASLDSLQLRSNAGGANIARVVGLALLVVSLDRVSKVNTFAAAGGAALAILSFALMGHTAIHPLRWLLAPLLLVHVAVVAFWFGALWPLQSLVRMEPGDRAAAVVARFSGLALRLVPLVLICGVAIAVVLIRSWAELFSAYGAFVLAKTALFGAVLAVAALNTWRAAPRIASGGAAAIRAFIRTVRAEWALLALVLVATAVMTTLFAPEHLEGSFSDHLQPTHQPEK
ncbi:MAG TPA: CopD family protein [Gammaproteobacteria bacterium]|nr:CopD family protein [Gammaproteobacteria bacterium]